jgi:hypothetical protein
MKYATSKQIDVFDDSNGDNLALKIVPELLTNTTSWEERGAVFTKKEVVEFILDLMGYTVDQPLYDYRLLEPAFGEGSFLLVAIRRLLSAWKVQSKRLGTQVLRDAIAGIELHTDSFQLTRQKVIALILEEELSYQAAEDLAGQWLNNTDFLLTDIKGGFDHIVGNPPYVRQELIAPHQLRAYRRRYSTIYDRADLYVPFFERSLSLLGDKGQLGFICTDRWMKNRYGGPLRRYISDKFHLRYYVNMVGTAAFETDVMTYPAITIIDRAKGTITRAAEKPEITPASLKMLCSSMQAKVVPLLGSVEEIENVATGADPWILHAPEERALVKRLERFFPLLEDTGCKVGIGVATGADSVFIAAFEELQVERDRKIPLVMTKDILEGQVAWKGLGVINPFTDKGALVNLDEYPLLKDYFSCHRASIERRHVASKNPKNWYRTIDRIYPALAKVPKLLIPDIKGDAHIVHEAGNFYPHHNLYYITATSWNLKALQVVLQSGIARLFVSTYSTQMRGGYLRFQAQYLRKIRLPSWDCIADAVRGQLLEAADSKDAAFRNRVVAALYGLTEAESQLLF